MKFRFWLEWAIAYAVCFVLCYYFQFQSPYIPETDGYFHIKVAALMRQQHGLFTHGFPWAAFSMWKDSYSDGCLLYHLFLMPFTYGDLAAGLKFATVLLSAFAFSSFFMILTLNQVRYRFFWFWILLLGGEFFWWRLMAPRPQVMSVSFLIWGLHFVLNGKKRPFMALMFFYPLAYVAAFLPLVFAFIRWAYLALFEKRREESLLLGGLAAYALGMLVHPYFPKNLLFFYVQNLWVMYFAVTQEVNLYLGMEFFPMDTRRVFFPHLPLILLLTSAAFVFIHRRVTLSERTRVIFPCFVMLTFMTFISKRFTEYAVPTATLFCALVFTDLVRGDSFTAWVRRYRAPAKVLTVVAVAFLSVWTYRWHMVVLNDFRTLPPPRFEQLAQVLAQKAPAGETIFSCDWDEAPLLLFYNDQHRYLVMMDPTFMYYWNPAIWRSWFETSNLRLAPDEAMHVLTDRFHSRFGLCGNKFQAFHQWVRNDSRFKVLQENNEGFAFEIVL